MREGYGSHFVCECVCVCVRYHASCYIPRLYVENKVPLSFLWRSQDMYCVDFVENALFKVLVTFADHLCHRGIYNLCLCLLRFLPVTWPLEGSLGARQHISEMCELQQHRYHGRWDCFRQGINELTESDDINITAVGMLHNAVASIMFGNTDLSLSG